MIRAMEGRPFAFAGVLVVLALAACGGAAPTERDGRTVTVPSYGGFQATTVVGSYSVRACRHDVAGVVGDARQYISHSTGAAPAPADLYYLELGQAYLYFRADACDPAALGAALKRELHPEQRSWLVHNLSQQLSHAIRTALQQDG